MLYSDSFKCVISNSPTARVILVAIYRPGHLERCRFTAGTIAPNMKTARCYAGMMQQRGGKRRTDAKRQTRIVYTQRRDFIAPLLDCTALLELRYNAARRLKHHHLAVI